MVDRMNLLTLLAAVAWGAVAAVIGLICISVILPRLLDAPHVLLIAAALSVLAYLPLKALERALRPNPWRRSWWR